MKIFVSMLLFKKNYELHIEVILWFFLLFILIVFFPFYLKLPLYVFIYCIFYLLRSFVMFLVCITSNFKTILITI